MEDPRWLKVITVGLILAALAVGYFLLTGRFNGTTPTNRTESNSNSQQVVASPLPSPQAIVQASPTPTPAVSGVNNQTGAQTLPNTGNPLALVVIFSISAATTGFFLRKYPN